jgi:transporter family-2 protein
MWAGGAFGVCFVALAVMLLPRLGASGFIALALPVRCLLRCCWIISGCSVWWKKQMTLPRVFGAVLLISGVVLIQFGDSTVKVLAQQ